jgi:hypothetical protein
MPNDLSHGETDHAGAKGDVLFAKNGDVCGP